MSTTKWGLMETTFTKLMFLTFGLNSDTRYELDNAWPCLTIYLSFLCIFKYDMVNVHYILLQIRLKQVTKRKRVYSVCVCVYEITLVKENLKIHY